MSEEWKLHGYTLREIYNSLGFPCQATLANGRTFSGQLYNVDPETLTLLILQAPPKPTPTQEQSSEQAKDIILETSEQQQQQQECPLPENPKKPQDQEPTQTQTQAQVSPSTKQHPKQDATLATTVGTQSVRPTMVAIRQHALKAFSIDTSATEGSRLTIETMESLAGLPSPPSISPVDIESRKQSIITMLDSQRIPWKTTGGEGERKEEGEVIQLAVGGARIKPPYTTSSVDCPNKVILERVQGMIREHDFNNKKVIATSSSSSS
ncbi:hypothetical protein K457DRAFT_124144 [Linnemannia elongata AG-77]|uniref:AD domain-containing protein n=1 Tax=Linnemannia elongata AG-77 TaxID=1314771 RepID=A0A197K2U2_9FUNG|nr:hypothetical protein K457DRAFT_124144 [Linnemannia elongata AG-77]